MAQNHVFTQLYSHTISFVWILGILFLSFSLSFFLSFFLSFSLSLFFFFFFCGLYWKNNLQLCIRVLDNLKDYAVRALVNAVDHLGTVAYKLTDLLDQQTLDVSTMELKVSCVNQVRFFAISSLSILLLKNV